MIQLSTKGRYATRIMVYLAIHNDGPYLQKQEIANEEDISPHYVEQILLRLKAAGLIATHRGRHGGVSLSCSPEETTVAQVLNATEGPIQLVPCARENCQRFDCVTRPVWEQATQAMTNVFANISIADLARKKLNSTKGHTPSYAI